MIERGKQGWSLVLMLCLLVSSVSAEQDFHVDDVVLSREVKNRNPRGIFKPPAYCEKDKNGHAAIPVVRTSQTIQVMFWTRIKAVGSGTIRHSWHHKIDSVWTKIQEVNIPVHPSPGYRIWSKKTLQPGVHTGEWMVVVSPSNEPERILCISRFSVQ